MKSRLWIFCVVFFMFLVAPVLMVLIALGPIGAGPAIVFKYWLPVGVCAVSIMILIFYRHGEQDKQT